ncbi:MAG: RNA polymerase sigma factor [Bryobacterales bacterium]|nr:RNA polymerase sigma factor [Bryobacterales bacterium]
MAAAHDDELMNRVREGDTDSLAHLFERHHRSLYRFFYQLCGSGGLAEDLTQEVFFRMLKFRATFQKDARFTPWMYQIARNVHVDHVRRKQAEVPLYQEHSEREFDPLDPGLGPELNLLRGADLAILRKALQRLPAERRELLVLSRWQNLRYDEIAAIVQCEPGAVKTRVFRAMRQLSDIFFRMSGRKAS